jgi:hypothetical protein
VVSVGKDDNMFAYLTVHETLLLAAQFYLPSTLSEVQKAKVVDSTLAELGLIKSRNTIIGDDNARGVSGGERKRTSIAIQLLTDPAVLFLDEPTSGLDAFQSQAVMECLKQLADIETGAGRLVITVIHQPRYGFLYRNFFPRLFVIFVILKLFYMYISLFRSSIYEMFDKLLVLSDGQTIYFGAAGAAVPYFTSVGYPCPEVFNPSDFFLDLLSPDNRSPEVEVAAKNRIRILAQLWKSAPSVAAARGGTVGASDNGTGKLHFNSVQMIGNSANSFEGMFRNFVLLCWRSFSEQSRNRGALIAKVVFSIFFGLVIGGIYSNVGNSQESIQNRKGALFFIMINQNFGTVTSVLNSFPKEQLIVGRERSARAYGAPMYFFAKLFVELPLNLVPLIIYNCIAYP